MQHMAQSQHFFMLVGFVIFLALQHSLFDADE